jgi:HK97 family phage major capsid protein
LAWFLIVKNLRELKQKRAKAIADARNVLDEAEKNGNAGKLTEDQERKYNAFFDESETLRSRIEKEEKLSFAEAELNDSDEPEGREKPKGKSEKAAGNEVRSFNPAFDTPDYRSGFQKYIQYGNLATLTADEQRVLQVGSSPDGGFFVPAQEMVNTLIKFVDDFVAIRPRATIHKVNQAVSLGIPSWDTDPADADWTTELATGSLDTAMKAGKRDLAPHPMAKRVKVSKALLRNSIIPVDTLVLQRLAYKFAITEEKGFLTGSGAQRPLGLFTASANGISTGRDVATDNTASAPTFDGLKNAKYTLKSQYWNKAAWIFHRDTVKLLAKIKDGEGRYIWQDGVVGTEADTLMGMPVIISEYAPNTYTTGLYVGVLGDLSFYHIADSLAMTVQQLNELYAEANQVGYIGRLETDGMPVLEEAFVRVKLG